MDSRGTNLSGSKSLQSKSKVFHQWIFAIVSCFVFLVIIPLDCYLHGHPGRQSKKVESTRDGQMMHDDPRAEGGGKIVGKRFVCKTFPCCGMEGILVEETIQKPKGTWLADSSSCSVTLLSDTGDRKYLLPPNGRPRLIIISVWVGLCLRNIDYLLLIGFIFQILGTYRRRG